MKVPIIGYKKEKWNNPEQIRDTTCFQIYKKIQKNNNNEAKIATLRMRILEEERMVA